MRLKNILVLLVMVAAVGCTRKPEQPESMRIQKGMNLNQAVELLQQAGFQRHKMDATIPVSEDEKGFVRNRVDMIPIELDVYVHQDRRAVLLIGGGPNTIPEVSQISYVDMYEPDNQTDEWTILLELDLTKH